MSLQDEIAAERERLSLARPDLVCEQAWIGGAWRGGAETIAVRNPSTRRLLGHVPAFGGDETREAIAAAHAAFPGWRARTAKDRGAILRRWNDLILANAEDLARLLTAEQGKPLAEARGEIAYAAAFIEWFAEEGRRAYGEVVPPHAADRRIVVTREPVGVVAAITPWNFPAAMITRKLGPALAAGCTVVLKPSELTPFTALALAKLAHEAGVDAGVLNIVTGAPAAIGEALTGDVRVRKLTFTGSTPVGRLLAAQCAGTVKRLSLELGGDAPFIVFADADLDAAVEGLMVSKFRNAGQTCVCANRVLVQAEIHDAFVERLTARVAALKIGDGFDPDVTIGPLIEDRAVEKVEGLVADALAGGARAAGERSAAPGFFAPLVLTGVTPTMAIARGEIFGPVAPVMAFSDEAEAIALANATDAGLAAYLYTRDLSRAWRVSEALEYGLVGLNTGAISTEVIPFGGVKQSGYGREGSRHGLDEYLSLKAVCLGV